MSDLIVPFDSEYEDYLRDESRLAGSAESISFPVTEGEVIEVIRECGRRGSSLTTQGARTGIAAGAVPKGGHILNLGRMTEIGEIITDGDLHIIKVQPGVTLDALREQIAPSGLFFPPDPTETTASIGGMAACNASGAMSFHYGPTRRWVESLRMVLSDGDVVSLKRGESKASGRAFSLTTESGRTISGRLPEYCWPAVKSAAGYYVADDMDLVDLFIGMEGTLGVLTEIGLRLIPKPAAIHGLTIFLPSEDAALKLVRALRGEFESVAVRPVAIEFFNSDALDLLRRMRTESAAFQAIPVLRPNFHTATYTEFHGESDEELEGAVMQLMDAILELGGNDEDTWYATTDRELEPLKAFRHAIPEAVDLLIDQRKRECPSLAKLGTDMSVPDACLEGIIATYVSELADAGLESVIFGHIGDNHLHVNILPNSPEDYERGKALYMAWARKIVELGGSVSAEHGIGKVKAPLLRLMYDEEQIDQMRALRKLFDPGLMLNPGDLFD